jgi:hypothetical protein
MKQKIKLESTVELPTVREQVMEKALRGLPECDYTAVPGWHAFSYACTRLAAAEQEKMDAEMAMHKSAALIRKYVQENWHPDEIPEDTRAVVLVW